MEVVEWVVDHQNLSTSYIVKDGDFIMMQSGLWLGSHDKSWQGVGLPDPGSLFSEQELVLVKEGPSLHFLLGPSTLKAQPDMISHVCPHHT